MKKTRMAALCILFALIISFGNTIPAIAADGASPNNWLVPWQQGVTSTMSQGYNGTFSHSNDKGQPLGFNVDFPLAEGTAVYAPTSGNVTIAGWDTSGYGYLIKMQTDDGFDVLMAHNKSIVAGKGRVERGQLLAYSGSTGKSTGNHMHFEIRTRGGAYDGNGILGTLTNVFGLPLSSYTQSNAGKTKLTGQGNGSTQSNIPGSMSASPAKSEFASTEDIIINWTTSENAKWYGITVRNDATGNKVYEQDWKTGNSLNIGKLPVGRYRFAMRGYSSYNPDVYGPTSSTAYFNVTEAAKVSPKILSVSPNTTTVTSGETIKVYVKTNADVNSVEFINESGEHCAGAYSPYNILPNGDKEWSIDWQTSKTGNRNIQVYAHIGSSFDKDYAVSSFSVTVNEFKVAPSIITITPEKNVLISGETLNVYIKTNGSVNSVEFINERGEHCAGGYSPTKTLSNGDKEWSVSWQTSTTGSRTIKVRAHIGSNFDDTYAEKSFSITVSNPVVTPDAPKLNVASVSLDKSSYKVGERAKITVKTIGSATQAFVLTETGEEFALQTQYSTSGKVRTFVLNWELGKAGNRVVWAGVRDAKGATDYEAFSLTIADELLKIFSVTVANTEVKVGDYCWMTVVTSSDITDIWIVNETGGETVYDLVRSYSVGSNKGWDIGWKLGKAGNRTGYVFATNGSNVVQSAFQCFAYN